MMAQPAHSPREVVRLHEGWRFTRTDDVRSSELHYDDSKWQSVVVPHDWAIYGPFDSSYDPQVLAISEDGMRTPILHAARTGGLPFVGVGWYRTTFQLPKEMGEEGTPGNVTLRFDGAMSNAKVYVNGKYAGEWPYGYNSFYLDVTKHVDAALDQQVVAVRLENPMESSRWYPGAGIYRNVYVVFTPEETRIAEWGTQITTPQISEEWAQVKVKTTIDAPTKGEGLSLKTLLLFGDNVVAESTTTDLYGDLFEQDFLVQEPQLWDLKTPHLYTAVTELYDGSRLIDSDRTTFGIRSIEVIPEEGFFLNGRQILFQGVCMHHDLGPLGAAVNRRALERQIRILQEMGVNAIRTSHNMPAPELVELANEMGMMVMVETFDELKTGKMKNGYHNYFDEWAERDVTNVVRHFRNAPAVVMWCLGNEVPDQGARYGNRVVRSLRDVCRREDPTRPITQGMNNVIGSIENNYAPVFDIMGINYNLQHYKTAYEKLPHGLVLGAETTSTVSSRGVYKFPVVRGAMKTYDDLQCSSYDVEHCGWSNLPEDDFLLTDGYPWTMGEFVWTGFDYLGEPTPYYTQWPSHSSYFGMVDLAGIPKDRFYLYRSKWLPEEETLHILPHWNWQGREGEVTPIFVYTNYPTAELFINGVSQGRRTKDTSITAENTSRDALDRLPRYRLMWMDTRYEPGTVKVVAYDEAGNAVATKELVTTGKPYAVKLTLENDNINADGEDLAFVRVQVVDRNGNICPTADHEISFRVKGAGSYHSSANGDATCTVPFQSSTMPLFSGQLTTIVQAGKTPGTAQLTASARGLKSATITINVK
ncbi:MAG: glycoside hydrolase family 2 TIM barrel-domain containing protein [Porphyromonas sp.]|nr:glycoside hydrolase family 2 TIM barrel-domain containing protein [Porphyromonas sp.]